MPDAFGLHVDQPDDVAANRRPGPVNLVGARRERGQRLGQNGPAAQLRQDALFGPPSCARLGRCVCAGR